MTDASDVPVPLGDDHADAGAGAPRPAAEAEAAGKEETAAGSSDALVQPQRKTSAAGLAGALGGASEPLGAALGPPHAADASEDHRPSGHAPAGCPAPPPPGQLLAAAAAAAAASCCSPPGRLLPAAATPPPRAAAAEFSPAAGGDDGRRTDVLAGLPAQHRSMLRTYFWDTVSNDWRAYYVGTLKSYSSRSGYGFLDSAQAYKDWGVDVFVHKNFVPTPWRLGQPVEFAVMMNNRGQPQALDTFWLPLLPQQRKAAAQGFAAALRAPPPPAEPAQPEGGEDEPGQDAETTDASLPQRPHRRLGTLKSYSPAQGYGFVSSEEVSREHKRDTYFDKSQLPADRSERLGQTVEFSVTLNSRDFPQARHIDWDPIPLLPPDPSRPQVTRTQGATRNHRPETLDKVRLLLGLLREAQLETAIVSAIDYQGGSHATSGEDDIDFVTLVLDRLGPEKQAMGAIKDFVKMLLLLMLAKMLRKRVDGKRSQQLTRWLEALSLAIDASVEGVREHYQDVLVQIKNHLEAARSENGDLQEQLLAVTLKHVMKRLEDKAKTAVGPPDPVAAITTTRAPAATAEASECTSEPALTAGDAQAPPRMLESPSPA